MFGGLPFPWSAGIHARFHRKDRTNAGKDRTSKGDASEKILHLQLPDTDGTRTGTPRKSLRSCCDPQEPKQVVVNRFFAAATRVS